MTILISEEEKRAIQDYFAHPERYINSENRTLLPDGFLPEGTKISRARVSDAIPRYYIIPAGMNNETLRLPITTAFPNDPETHSATMLRGTVYFHQNKDDLPKKLPINFNDYCEIDDDDAPEDENIVAYRQGLERALAKPNYTVQVNKFGLFKKTIKYAVDIEGRVSYLKSHSSSIEGAVSSPNRVEQYAPQLYMGPCIFRRRIFAHSHETKRIDITRDCGENLEIFMLRHEDTLSTMDINALGQEIIKQYLIQIHQQGIVHTDIKAANICIKKTPTAEQPFEVTFIDFDEAFNKDAPNNTGNGTPGYMAPEFFKTKADFEHQSENRGLGIATYCNTLKPDHKNLFSEASDIFALGTVLLNDLSLETSAHLYSLATAMCHIEPDSRPSGDELKETLEQNNIIKLLLEMRFSSYPWP